MNEFWRFDLDPGAAGGRGAKLGESNMKRFRSGDESKWKAKQSIQASVTWQRLHGDPVVVQTGSLYSSHVGPGSAPSWTAVLAVGLTRCSSGLLDKTQTVLVNHNLMASVISYLWKEIKPCLEEQILEICMFTRRIILDLNLSPTEEKLNILYSYVTFCPRKTENGWTLLSLIKLLFDCLGFLEKNIWLLPSKKHPHPTTTVTETSPTETSSNHQGICWQSVDFSSMMES